MGALRKLCADFDDGKDAVSEAGAIPLLGELARKADAAGVQLEPLPPALPLQGLEYEGGGDAEEADARERFARGAAWLRQAPKNALEVPTRRPKRCLENIMNISTRRPWLQNGFTIRYDLGIG